MTLCEYNGKETITSYIRELKLTSDESDVSNVIDVIDVKRSRRPHRKRRMRDYLINSRVNSRVNSSFSG